MKTQDSSNISGVDLLDVSDVGIQQGVRTRAQEVFTDKENLVQAAGIFGASVLKIISIGLTISNEATRFSMFSLVLYYLLSAEVLYTPFTITTAKVLW